MNRTPNASASAKRSLRNRRLLACLLLTLATAGHLAATTEADLGEAMVVRELDRETTWRHLGVYLREASPTFERRFGLPNAFRISRIHWGSPLGQMAREGDLIVGYNSQPVESISTFLSALSGQEGNEMRLDLIRMPEMRSETRTVVLVDWVAEALKNPKSDDPRILNNLGWMLQHGLGIGINESLALGYYRRAAALGNPEAMTSLGWSRINLQISDELRYFFDLNGLAWHPDLHLRERLRAERATAFNESLNWYRRGAAQGWHRSLAMIPHTLVLWGEARPREEELRELYRQAIEAGSRASLTSYGQFLEETEEAIIFGYPTPLAETMFRRAAMRGDNRAQYQMLRVYHYSAEPSMGTEEAADWFQIAAENGLRVAQMELAKSSRSGLFPGSNEGPHPELKQPARALAWYRFLMKQGDLRQTDIEEIEEQLADDVHWNNATDRFRDLPDSDAKALVAKALEIVDGELAGHEFGAMSFLSRSYLEGIGVTPDFYQGVSWEEARFDGDGVQTPASVQDRVAKLRRTMKATSPSPQTRVRFERLFSDWKQLARRSRPEKHSSSVRLGFGISLDQSVLESATLDEYDDQVRRSLNRGLACLQGLDSEASLRIGAQLLDTLATVEVSIHLEGHGNRSFLARASGPGEEKHGTIVLNRDAKGQDDTPWSGDDLEGEGEDSFQALLMHELLHTAGYLHGKGIDYPYAISRCCFHDTGHYERQKQQLACTVLNTLPDAQIDAKQLLENQAVLPEAWNLSATSSLSYLVTEDFSEVVADTFWSALPDCPPQWDERGKYVEATPLRCALRRAVDRKRAIDLGVDPTVIEPVGSPLAEAMLTQLEELVQYRSSERDETEDARALIEWSEFFLNTAIDPLEVESPGYVFLFYDIRRLLARQLDSLLTADSLPPGLEKEARETIADLAESFERIRR